MFSTHVLLYCARFFTADQNPHVRSSWSRKKKELRTRWNRWLINTGYIRIDPRDGSRRGGGETRACVARTTRSRMTPERPGLKNCSASPKRELKERSILFSWISYTVHLFSFIVQCERKKVRRKKKERWIMQEV